MVSDTATRKPRSFAPPSGNLARLWRSRGGQVTRFSLTRRILAVNMLAVALLGVGMLYLDRYERGLIDTELQALGTQSAIFAAALDEGAVLEDLGDGPVLVPSLAQGMMQRLVEPTRVRARLFMPDGTLVADSRSLSGPGGVIQVQELSPPGSSGPSLGPRLVRWFSGLLRARNHYPAYVEHAVESADEYPEVVAALDGGKSSMVRADPLTGGLLLSMAVPVGHYRQVLGALLLSTGSANLEHQVNSVRSDIVRLFVTSLVFTFLLSLYLAGTIARPLRRLARAAREARFGDGRKVEIPVFGGRRDEIGELAVAFADMTAALWKRMDAIEGFAADVAHEIKNPLSSLRSAVETAVRLKDPEQQRRLMAIILDDVQRLDRLISDISDASRLDAEMSRLERSPVDLTLMLRTLAEVHQATRDAAGPSLVFVEPELREPLIVLGKESRLVQVFQNLIANAVSFSPPGGVITLRAQIDQGHVLIGIEDQGCGLPEGKLDAIFDRFYTERPEGEKFGTHSGLGLSISKQIVEAHGGSICAENRQDAAGATIGARFRVSLPLAGAAPR